MTSPDARVEQQIETFSVKYGWAQGSEFHVDLAKLIAALLQESQEAITRLTDQDHTAYKKGFDNGVRHVRDVWEGLQASIQAAKGVDNWPCQFCGFGHSANIDQGYEQACERREKAALARAEAAEAALRAGRETPDQLRVLLGLINEDGSLTTFDQHVDLLTDAMHALKVTGRETPAPAWLPIASAPKDGTRVLFMGSRGIDIGCWEEAQPAQTESGVIVDPGLPQGWYGCLEYWPEEEQPTSWMPAPPSSSEADRP